jgi:hypothetical protein
MKHSHSKHIAQSWFSERNDFTEHINNGKLNYNGHSYRIMPNDI